jgi:hypothetical protein
MSKLSNFTKSDLGKCFVSTIGQDQRCSIIRIIETTKEFVVCQELNFTYGKVWNDINYNFELAKLVNFKHEWRIVVGLHSYVNKKEFFSECTLLVPLLLGIGVQPVDGITTKQRWRINKYKHYLRLCPALGAYSVDE